MGARAWLQERIWRRKMLVVPNDLVGSDRRVVGSDPIVLIFPLSYGNQQGGETE